MPLPSSYLTSTKRLPDILEAIQTAQAPDKFTTRFLDNLGFKSKGDRLIIGVLKSIDFLDDDGSPTDRYYKYLDQSQAALVLAESIRHAYGDLFALNINANEFSKDEFIGKVKTLSQGKLTDNVMNFMFLTFSNLVEQADFTSPPPKKTDDPPKPKVDPPKPIDPTPPKDVKLGGLVYNIQIVLPETRDTAVYDALFRSLKEHLL